MKIRFEVWMEDLVEYQRHLAGGLQHLRRARRTFVIQMVALCLVLGGTMSLTYGTALFLVPAALCAGPAGVSAYFLHDWFVHRNARRVLSEGVNRVLLGRREVELAADVVISRSRYVATHVNLAIVERITEERHYAFVDISGLEGFMICRQDVPEAEYEAFMAELRRRWDEARNAPEQTEDHPAPSLHVRRAPDGR